MPVHRYALRIGPSPEACHQDDGTSNSISSLLRPSTGHLYRRPNFAIRIVQGEYRADTTVGGYITKARLRHSSRQVPCNPLVIGRVLGHTSEQPEDAVPSAEGQDEINSSRDLWSLLRKRQRHSHSMEVLQSPWQAKLVKWSRHFRLAAFLAASSPDEEQLVRTTCKDGMHLNS